ncbi:MAG: hypothetical protein J0L70_11025 [Leptolyngbya sp. UWPOB_LEPTO1]|uniref:hypothetical protein n=1 Tax=Leptolyngbya sp. UWPOB_LEPTO1 TaxID=2815653 RepID=UPI001AC49DC6|nr:hypothetical protein [Leptolyngbya sp. UWPOB_LEPTO1]MBN8561048.1 hypothetical protein [Leptolyngbya sp. UWPOB_LEPTO1]
MNTPNLLLKRLLALGAVVSLVTLSTPATAVPVTIQTEASAGNAIANKSDGTGGSAVQPALITVLVIDSIGKPISNDTFLSSFPGGWTFKSIATPQGGCPLNQIQVLNLGNQQQGAYLIRVIPGCRRWVSGDYFYTFQISTPTQDGVALGKLTIR